jgi:hypothetical protein
MTHRLRDYISCDENGFPVLCHTENKKEKEKPEVEYRQCREYKGYIAGSDGSIWKGYLDKAPELWMPMSTKKDYNTWAVWVQYEGAQVGRRVAELILDAWGVDRTGKYIGYRDGNPDNLHPDNLYYARSKKIAKDASKKQDRRYIKRIRALAAVGDTPQEIARLVGRPVETVRKILAGRTPSPRDTLSDDVPPDR